jgi:hypothetical protein
LASTREIIFASLCDVVSGMNVEFRWGVLLLSNGRLLDEFLAKDNALVTPFQAFLNNGSRLSDDGTCHHKAFMVKIRHCKFVSGIHT